MRIALLLVTVGLGVSGCDRSHLRAGFGQQVHQAFNAQVDLSANTNRKPTQGLDPEEAAVVLETYRKSLSPTKDSSAAKGAPVLLLPPPGAQGAPTAFYPPSE